MAQQIARVEDGVAIADGQSPQRRSVWWRYLLVLVLIPLLFYPFPFLIATSPNYEHWATSEWGPMLEYAYQPQEQNADVVIFGDSSAFIGVDPKLLNAQLGIRSLVLPDTIGSIPVTGDGPLALYMKRNRAPRLLVLYFSPWNLDFNQIAGVRRFEGEEMMLRHASWGEIAHFTLHHPTEMLVFPFRLYSTFGPKMVTAALHHVNRERDTADALGHADYNAGFAPLSRFCVLPDELRDPNGDSSVETLVRRYSTPETKVMVYLAPLPACAGTPVVATRSYAKLGAAAPKVLPAPFFAGDRDYAHVLPPHVPESTALFAKAIAPELRALHVGAASTSDSR